MIRDLIIRSLIETDPETFDNSLNDDTPIFGTKGNLDSLGLVSFLVNLEQYIEDKYGIPITIADEKAMSLKNSPFRTINTLSEYLNGIINENE